MSLAAVVSATGITAPTYAQILAELTASFKTIYGADTYLAPDSQDGQWISIFAQAVYDANMTAVAVYNQFSPKTSQGVGLSQVVKINGLRRHVASSSIAQVRIVGQVGTVIQNGVVGDNQNLNTRWALPPEVIIPIQGEISVTAQAQELGDISAAPGTLTEILTPTIGWQTVENLESALPGAPVEDDVDLRKRQSISTSLPALSVMSAIIAAVANLDGVTRIKGYENDTSTIDSSTLIPPHSISIVVEGGDSMEIASTINLTKTPGTGTYGDENIIVTDPNGVPNWIQFFYLDLVRITVRVDIQALNGYVAATADKVKAAIAYYIGTLEIGEVIYLNKLNAPANLSGEAAQLATGLTQGQLDALSKTYVVTIIMQERWGSAEAPVDLPMNFHEAPFCLTDDITVNVS